MVGFLRLCQHFARSRKSPSPLPQDEEEEEERCSAAKNEGVDSVGDNRIGRKLVEEDEEEEEEVEKLDPDKRLSTRGEEEEKRQQVRGAFTRNKNQCKESTSLIHFFLVCDQEDRVS